MYLPFEPPHAFMEGINSHQAQLECSICKRAQTNSPRWWLPGSEKSLTTMNHHTGSESIITVSSRLSLVKMYMAL